jgi:hypothetical protein
MIGPCAAKGGFPYPHRTIGEVWDGEERRVIRRLRSSAVPALPPVLTWCDQCELRVTAREVGVCRNRFCTMRAAA